MSSVASELVQIPKIDAKALLGLTELPRVDVSSMVLKMPPIPRIDTKALLGLTELPKLDVSSMVLKMPPMPKIDTKALLGLTELPRVELVIEQIGFGLKQAEPLLAAPDTGPARSTDYTHVLFQAWEWLGLTPAQRAVQNSFLGAVIAACWFVQLLLQDPVGELILGSATVLLAVLVWLTAVEDNDD